MQTFAPLSDFAAIGAVLDRQRLGKQRVEVMQILRALDPAVATNGWSRHPAVLMWRDHAGALARYGLAIVAEWVGRGYRDVKCGPVLREYADRFPDVALPPWWGDDAFHRAHRSNLIRKLPEHYGPLWPDVPADLPYLWPTP